MGNRVTSGFGMYIGESPAGGLTERHWTSGSTIQESRKTWTSGSGRSSFLALASPAYGRLSSLDATLDGAWRQRGRLARKPSRAYTRRIGMTGGARSSRIARCSVLGQAPEEMFDDAGSGCAGLQCWFQSFLCATIVTCNKAQAWIRPRSSCLRHLSSWPDRCVEMNWVYV